MISVFHLASFQVAFDWVIAHGYFLMFLAMLIEGPIVTAAAAFATVFGYFNIYIVFILSLLGDIVADVIYYAIGYFSREKVIEKFGHYFGLSQERMDKIETLLNTHPKKTLIALKLMPVIPTPGLMIVGTVKMPIKKFIILCTYIIIPKTIFFMVVGYYFGAAYDMVYRRFEKGGLILLSAALLIILIYLAFNKITAIIAKRIEKI